MAGKLSNASDTDMVMAITRLREVSGVTEAMVFTGNSRLVAFSSSAYGQLLPDLPPTSVINQLRVSRAYSRSEEHTSELQSLMRISYAVFCLKKKNHRQIINS